MRAPILYPFSSSFLPETRAIILRALKEGFNLPNLSTLSAIDSFIGALLASNLWNKFDTLLIGAFNDTNLREFTSIDWRYPFQELSIIGADVIYTQNGWKAVGGGYLTSIRTRINKDNHIVSTPDNLHYMAVVYDVSEALTTNTRLISAETTNGKDVFSAINGTGNRITTNIGALDSAADLTGTGLKNISRFSSTDVYLCNKNIEFFRTQPMTGFNATGFVQIFQNSTTRYSKLGLSCYSIGASLHNGEALIFRNLFNAFLKNIGLEEMA